MPTNINDAFERTSYRQDTVAEGAIQSLSVNELMERSNLFIEDIKGIREQN